MDIGLIIEQQNTDKDSTTVFLGSSLHRCLPLTSLGIELTDGCNLRCSHCYGAFNTTSKPNFVPFDWIKQSLNDLNCLHVRKIGLTGGEPTMHPHFFEIAMFFMEYGFDLWILTNGYNTEIISQLLKSSRKYHLNIKASLDGLGDVHNTIRGDANAYSNAIKTIEAIYECPNVVLYISTAVLRQNIESINCLKDFITRHFPNAIHSIDLGFPLGNANSSYVFSIDELSVLNRKIPDLFILHDTNKNDSRDKAAIKRWRCTGGISQCTLKPDGILKICNAACDSQFFFKHNAFYKGLRYSWINCGEFVKRFRQERPASTSDCKKCADVQDCNGNNCRVLAWVYGGSAMNSNPITCFTTRKSLRGEGK